MNARRPEAPPRRCARAVASIATLAALVGALGPGAATTARADGKNECLLAYENAQLLRRKGDMRGARSAARQCARAECNEALRRDCVAWVPEIEKEIPTVIFRARRGAQDLSAVRVSVDGERATELLDGRGVEVDAGERRFVFEAEGLPQRETRALVAVGEKNRIISVSFDEPGAAAGGDAAAPGGAPAGEGGRGVLGNPWRVGALAAAGVGLVGLGVGLGFGLDARSKRDRANERCDETTCRDERGLDLTDGARSSAAVSTVAFAIGGVGLAAGLGLWLLAPDPKPGAAAGRGPRPAGASVAISLAPGGARLWGAFP
jgi:hypothetical protein